MKITEVKAYVVAAAMPKPWRIGNYVLEKGYAVIVEVVTDEGISGFGEAIGRLGRGYEDDYRRSFGTLYCRF
jgi:L-alanine-DL-glutamate epimerase-like enolase superfamily enzyme